MNINCKEAAKSINNMHKNKDINLGRVAQVLQKDAIQQIKRHKKSHDNGQILQVSDYSSNIKPMRP